MDEEKIAQQLSDILPDSQSNLHDTPKSAAIAKEASRIKARQEAKELARLKYLEKSRLNTIAKRIERNEQLAEEYGSDVVPNASTEAQARQLLEQQKRVEAIEAIEAQAVSPLEVSEIAKRSSTSSRSSSVTLQDALKLQGTSRPEMTKLLTSLNINLSIQLTKTDTANLLACLLTCNESQLRALMSNKKIPIAVKTVIKRLIEDEKLGNIETIEKLWDRIFGKGPMKLDLPETQSLNKGIIPDQPISREAYIILRDTLIK